MIATFAIELALAGYVAWRYRLSKTMRLILATLVCLAVFQAAEFVVCTAAVPALAASRIGFIAITLLPPLGIHLGSVISGRRTKLVPAAYAMAAGFISVFLLAPSAIYMAACTGNYAIFKLDTDISILYGLYYHSWLLLGIILALSGARQNPRHAASLRYLAVGYMVFMVPAAVVITVHPPALAGIPSVMCGFAVIFALLLALFIAPGVLARRATSQPARRPAARRKNA